MTDVDALLAQGFLRDDLQYLLDKKALGVVQRTIAGVQISKEALRQLQHKLVERDYAFQETIDKLTFHKQQQADIYFKRCTADGSQTTIEEVEEELMNASAPLRDIPAFVEQQWQMQRMSPLQKQDVREVLMYGYGSPQVLKASLELWQKALIDFVTVREEASDFQLASQPPHQPPAHALQPPPYPPPAFPPSHIPQYPPPSQPPPQAPPFAHDSLGQQQQQQQTHPHPQYLPPNWPQQQTHSPPESFPPYYEQQQPTHPLAQYLAAASPAAAPSPHVALFPPLPDLPIGWEEVPQPNGTAFYLHRLTGQVSKHAQCCAPIVSFKMHL